MKFVLGKPVKNGDPCWYVKLDCREAEEFVASILRGNSKRFAMSSHQDDTTVMLANTSMLLAMQIDTGLHNRGGYYVGKSGGMCPNLVEIIEEVESNTWPGKPSITVSQWPGGKHYYVRVNGVNLEWRGKTKWNTEEYARRAAEEFIKSSERIGKRKYEL